MKQNERLLVYAVTGFLALILIIAVVFGSEPANAGGSGAAGAGGTGAVGTGAGGNAANAGGGNQPRGLDELLGRYGVDSDGGNSPASSKTTRLPSPNALDPRSEDRSVTEQPLRAKLPVADAVLVERTLGQSRRERMVRWVPVRRGDSWTSLVLRWCGKSAGFIDEARQLNEETSQLREGSEVMVPWVDDEKLAGRIRAERERTQPRTLMPNAGAPNAGVSVAGPTPTNLSAGPAGASAGSSLSSPGFEMPGRSAAGPAQPAAGQPAAVVGGSEYTVAGGDSLWRIAARKYGAGQADRMVRAMKQLNPGLTEKIKVGQKIQLPAQ
ncbi:MAG: LysM peptidoglycan-binding domain-containing protein [Planctomycetota bacterium]